MWLENLRHISLSIQYWGDFYEKCDAFVEMFPGYSPVILQMLSTHYLPLCNYTAYLSGVRKAISNVETLFSFNQIICSHVFDSFFFLWWIILIFSSFSCTICNYFKNESSCTSTPFPYLHHTTPTITTNTVIIQRSENESKVVLL